MKQLFTYPKTIQRMYEGPLGDYIESYLNLLTRQGFAKNSIRKRIRLVANLSRWLDYQAISINDLNEQTIDRYLCSRKYVSDIDKPALTRLLGLLREMKIIAKPPDPKTDKTRQLIIEEDFKRYLLQERGLSRKTVVGYLPLVPKIIIELFGARPAQFDKLCSDDIIEFVQRFVYGSNSLSSAEKIITVLRIFLRYLRYQGEIDTDLAACVPSVAKWKLASLPKFLKPDQVQLVLKSCNRQTFIGKRNYAILLLLSRLGLRAGEVATLKIEDIDWEGGTITICGKGGCKDRFPLMHDVGEAIAFYLRSGRPNCSSRCVFVRHIPPIRGFKNYMAISSMVRRQLERANVGNDLPYKGAHLFRHTLATEMLHHGTSLGEVGEILRHKSPNTTAIYAKVDITALRSIVQPWPGGDI